MTASTDVVFSRLDQLFSEAEEGIIQAKLRLEIYELASQAFRLEAPPRPRYRALIQQALTYHGTATKSKGDWSNALGRLAEPLLPELTLAPDDLSLLERLMGHQYDIWQWKWKAMNPEVMQAAVGLFLDRALEGALEPPVHPGLFVYRDYTGIDHFAKACRNFAKHPKVKVPTDRYMEYRIKGEGILEWSVVLLRRIKPPSAADFERAAELAGIDKNALVTACLFAPTWAPLAEPYLDWPGFGALVRWLGRYGGPPPWSDYHTPQAGEEEETGAIDREAALAALEQMGDKLYRQLIKHPVARAEYRDGLFYLQAIRGENAADVEARFVKRSKQAVRALGLLPDEGDILQRYLALRRFAKEAKQFGAKRQASERLAAESGLMNLAATAGYADLSQLEWMMEAQVADEADPAAKRWTVDDYTVWIQPDAKATLMVERGGKLLKSVPPAVRQTPEYEEIRETRELLTAQWDRVRRRLEAAMALGEEMSRENFAPGLRTPAGRAMIPALVLRCRLTGQPEPVELCDGRTLDGEQIDPERIETYQVAHPVHLAEAGRLTAWQKQVKVDQPFPQVFREYYLPRKADRFAGRSVRVGTMVEKLKRAGWQPDQYELSRRLPGRAYAHLTFENGWPFMPPLEVVVLGPTEITGHVGPTLYSEIQRDVDLASAAASPEPVTLANERS